MTVINWFGIGWAILAVLVIPPVIWYHLPDRVQEFFKIAIALSVCAAILGFLAWGLVEGGGT